MKALTLAEHLGLKPEVAHCHLALAKLYQVMGKSMPFQKELNFIRH
jgi:hypothetical protein